MSDYVWCHGPSCHEQHTQDRIRGTSGSKVLRTRKIKLHPEYINMYSYFCSNGCYNNFANKKKHHPTFHTEIKTNLNKTKIIF